MVANRRPPISPTAGGQSAENARFMRIKAAKDARAKASGSSAKVGGSSGGTNSGSTGVFDPEQIKQALKNEEAPFINTNPPFIYPGPNIRLGTTGEVRKIERGYIRRLTEFYGRMLQNNTQPDNPSTIQNMRCNFQFNPDSITRSIEARTDMQFFFNQEPNQLAQPIPGNAGFGFELLFNREAELHSGTYVGESGNHIPGSLPSGLTPDYFIREQYDPSWVTKIGVLADIMMLDDIVGQGIAKDILKEINAGRFEFLQEDTSSGTGDEGDQTESQSSAKWDSGRLKAFNFSANLGNKAFLVPTPVRIMFSPWFMVEGFVQAYQVTFNKFTPEMIPSQASVAIQMQALYVGFAQQKTFLTDFPPPTPDDSGTGESNIPRDGTPERDIYDETKASLSNYIDKAAHNQGAVEGPLDLLDCFFANSAKTQEINFTARVSKTGQDYYYKAADSGTELTFVVKGEIKVWWDRHVTGASNSRQNVKTKATGAYSYAPGPPPSEEGTNYSIYGTSASPFIATLAETPVYYSRGRRQWSPDTADYMILGKIDRFNKLVSENGRRQWIFSSQGTPAMWTWSLKKPSRLPFEEDKFNVSLELTLTAIRNGQPVESPQKIVGRWYGKTADDDVLFNGITPIRTTAANTAGKAPRAQ